MQGALGVSKSGSMMLAGNMRQVSGCRPPLANSEAQKLLRSCKWASNGGYDHLWIDTYSIGQTGQLARGRSNPRQPRLELQ
jgi:hypothetical protein